MRLLCYRGEIKWKYLRLSSGGGEFTVNTDNGCNDRSQTETGADHCGPWPRFHCANYSPIVVVVEELSNVRHLRQAKL